MTETCLTCTHWDYQHYSTGQCNVCKCQQLRTRSREQKNWIDLLFL